MSEWYQTDDDAYQFMRNETQNKYSIIQYIELDITDSDLKENPHLKPYIVLGNSIDLDDVEDEEVIQAIESYGYSVVGLIDIYGIAAKEIIAECCLETDLICDSNILFECYTEAAAKNFIEKYMEEHDG